MTTKWGPEDQGWLDETLETDRDLERNPERQPWGPTVNEAVKAHPHTNWGHYEDDKRPAAGERNTRDPVADYTQEQYDRFKEDYDHQQKEYGR